MSNVGFSLHEIKYFLETPIAFVKGFQEFFFLLFFQFLLQLFERFFRLFEFIG